MDIFVHTERKLYGSQNELQTRVDYIAEAKLEWTSMQKKKKKGSHCSLDEQDTTADYIAEA